MRVRVVRPDDLLVCEFEFVNIDIEGSAPNRQLVVRRGADARVIMHVPPQHVAEQVYPEEAPPRGPVHVPARIAGPTRLVFRVPAKKKLRIDYKLEAILELLKSCTLAIAANAVKGPQPEDLFGVLRDLFFYGFAPAVSEPSPDQTAIELPLRLILSPDEYAGFAHAVSPVTDASGNRVELWHTRLQPRPGPGVGPENEPGRRVRAVWMRRGNEEEAPSWDPTRPRWREPLIGDDEPFPLNTMSQRDRHDLVHATSNWRYTRQTRQNYIPQPVEVHRLALTSLGAWLESRWSPQDEWQPPERYTSLLAWIHRATQGRDHYVKLVYAGYLYPFGHSATKIKISERTFGDEARGEPPLLLQHEYIVVRDELRTYHEPGAPPWQKHTMPLRPVELITTTTPHLAAPRTSDGGGGQPGDRVDEHEDLHVIRAAQAGSPGSEPPFLFALTGTDVEHNVVELSTPLVWVNSTRAWDTDWIERAKRLYAAEPAHELDARGVPMALAPGPAGDTTFTTYTLRFTAPQDPMQEAPPRPAEEGQPQRTSRPPGFWPQLEQAKLGVPALQHIAGIDSVVAVSYHDSYANHGLGGANAGEVFAQLDTPLGLDFSEQGERAGALVRPSMLITGLSRQLGPVGGPADPAVAKEKLDAVAAGRFFPEDFFAGADAKLFGVFDLDMVLKRIDNPEPIEKPRIAAEGGAEALVAKFVWKPKLQNYPSNDTDANPENAVEPTFAVSSATTMEVSVLVDARGVDARVQTPRMDVEARIENFSLNLLGGLGGDLPTFLRLDFDRIEFVAPAGKKPDVSVVLGGVEFAGDLAFVERLRTIIPLDGFADPPAIEVSPDGIASKFSVSVPSLAVGVFGLQNVSLGAGFTVPFIAGHALTVSFNFCTREEPFLLTVALFGGGGFFALVVDPAGVRELEAALEFGASVAIDLGVAQGGVQVMGGVYFSIPSGEGCTLSGYFRLCGNMSVLGLISASIELELEFTYRDGKAVGRAEIEVEIDIFLFSFSVTVECERRFAGSAGDPSFLDLMAPYPDPEQLGQTVRPWDQYCRAYA